MTPTKFSAMALTCVLAAMSTVGCCDKEKKLITGLSAEIGVLRTSKMKLQGEVASLKAADKSLRGELDSRDAQLLGASQRENDLRNQLAAAATPPTPPEPKDTGKGATGWDVGKHADRVSLTSDILFASGRATLTSAGRGSLSRVVSALNGTYAGMPVRVFGYTDGDPIRKTKKLWQDNLDLSANRAMAVTRYLRGAGVAPDRIETVGMGKTRPIAPNTSKTSKGRNRRVEIVVIK